DLPPVHLVDAPELEAADARGALGLEALDRDVPRQARVGTEPCRVADGLELGEPRGAPRPPRADAPGRDAPAAGDGRRAGLGPACAVWRGAARRACTAQTPQTESSGSRS